MISIIGAGPAGSYTAYLLAKKGKEVIVYEDGNKIGDFDCAIAGIYLANSVNKIITGNVKHFERIKGLRVIGY